MNALTRAVTLLGSQVAMARAVGGTVKQQHVWKWLRSGRVPAEHVIGVSRATGWKVTPHQLRPDIYPNVHDGLPVGDVTLRESVASGATG